MWCQLDDHQWQKKEVNSCLVRLHLEFHSQHYPWSAIFLDEFELLIAALVHGGYDLVIAALVHGWFDLVIAVPFHGGFDLVKFGSNARRIRSLTDLGQPAETVPGSDSDSVSLLKRMTITAFRSLHCERRFERERKLIRCRWFLDRRRLYSLLVMPSSLYIVEDISKSRFTNWYQFHVSSH